MILLILFSQIAVSVAQEYSFCSENSLYSFTAQLCPGGVLLKEAIKIDEPCFCFGADLKIHEDCKNEGILKTATFPGCLAPLIQPSDKWSGKAKFLLPSENFTQTKTGEFEFCPKIRDSCTRLDKGTLTGPDLFNEVSSDDMYQLRRIRQNNGTRCSVFDGKDCVDDKTQIIKDNVEILTYIQKSERLFVISNVFRLLKISVEVFKVLAPEWMIPDTTMDNIFNIFHLKYKDLDSIRTDKHLREEKFIELKHKLEKCLTNTRELMFVEDKSTCPPKVGPLVHLNEELGQSETLDTVIPDDRKYIKDQEDLLIGVIWKVVDAIHKNCFLYNHYFFTNLEELFLDPSVQDKHYNTGGYGTLLYTGIVDHDDLQVFMENVDKIDAAVHAIAKDKTYFKKPKRDVVKSSSRIRLKRSTETKFIEIWGGRAYCLLQKKSIATFADDPKLKKVCDDKLVEEKSHCMPYPITGDALKNVSLTCPQNGLVMKNGFFRMENNVTESCCYNPINCVKKDTCAEECKRFCETMKAQLLSSENLMCKCTHSLEFLKSMHD